MQLATGVSEVSQDHALCDYCLMASQGPASELSTPPTATGGNDIEPRSSEELHYVLRFDFRPDNHACLLRLTLRDEAEGRRTCIARLGDWRRVCILLDHFPGSPATKACTHRLRFNRGTSSRPPSSLSRPFAVPTAIARTRWSCMFARAVDSDAPRDSQFLLHHVRSVRRVVHDGVTRV